MPEDRTIRSAGFDDAQSIFELIRLYPKELLPRSLGDIAQNTDRFLVCQKGQRVVGTVSWQILPEIGVPKNPAVEIQSLAVLPDLRGQGIGVALVTTAIDRIRPLHPSQIVALTFDPDFFRKLGFREISKEKLIHKIYTGCINCTKYDNPFTCPETAMVLEL